MNTKWKSSIHRMRTDQKGIVAIMVGFGLFAIARYDRFGGARGYSLSDPKRRPELSQSGGSGWSAGYQLLLVRARDGKNDSDLL